MINFQIKGYSDFVKDSTFITIAWSAIMLREFGLFMIEIILTISMIFLIRNYCKAKDRLTHLKLKTRVRSAPKLSKAEVKNFKIAFTMTVFSAIVHCVGILVCFFFFIGLLMWNLNYEFIRHGLVTAVIWKCLIFLVWFLGFLTVQKILWIFSSIMCIIPFGIHLSIWFTANEKA